MSAESTQGNQDVMKLVLVAGHVHRCSARTGCLNAAIGCLFHAGDCRGRTEPLETEALCRIATNASNASNASDNSSDLARADSAEPVHLAQGEGSVLPPKSINIRIPPHLAENFEALKSRFGGLPPSTIVRFMISDLLERPVEEQVRIITNQIQRPSGPKTAGRAKPGTNTKNRLAGV